MDDRRIREIVELLDTNDYDVLSLDIFDTTIWRNVPAPKDVFLLVGGELLERGWLHASSTPASFLRERATAEERARLASRSREVTLADIYGEFPVGYLRGIGVEQVMELELETEARCIRVNPDIRRLVERARSRGLTTAFVSDTYFTRQHIARLVDLEVDHVILSSEHHLSKSIGLHRILLEQTGVAPARVLHVGNDYHADVEGPSVFSMARYWFREWSQPFEALIEEELPASYSVRSEIVLTPDGGLTTCRSRAMNRVTDLYEQWGAAVLGPLLTGFGDWVADTCARETIGAALCLMREGTILKQVLEASGASLAAGELYVSRYSARKAAILSGTLDEIAAFVLRPSAQRRGTLLAQLGLPEDALDGDPDEELSPGATRELVRRVHAQRSLRRRVVEDSARARAGLVRHLRSVLEACGVTGGRVAIVDLGYKGTIQECLQRICDHERLGITTHGLYLVTGGKVHETQKTGATVEGWLAENGQPIQIAHTFMRSPEIVEQSLMAPCGTTLGHAADGTPALDADRVPAAQRQQIEAVQRGALRFAELWAEREAPEPYTPELRALYRAICIRAIARPFPVELELFGGWVHDENFGSGAARGLLELAGMDPWERDHMTAHQLASLPMSRLYWPFGFARQLGTAMGEAVTHIYLRTVRPEVFGASSDERRLLVCWDTGGGFDGQNTSVEPLRLNQDGRAWQRFSIPRGRGNTVKQVGFSVGAPGDVVSLTGINVHLRDAAGTQTLRHPGATLEKHGYRLLYRDLHLVEAEVPLVMLPLEGVADASQAVDLDLFVGVAGGA